MNGKDRPARVTESPDGLVAILQSIGTGADNRDRPSLSSSSLLGTKRTSDKTISREIIAQCPAGVHQPVKRRDIGASAPSPCGPCRTSASDKSRTTRSVPRWESGATRSLKAASRAVRMDTGSGQQRSVGKTWSRSLYPLPGRLAIRKPIKTRLVVQDHLLNSPLRADLTSIVIRLCIDPGNLASRRL